MQIPILTTTNLHRHAAAVYAICQLIKSEGLDNHEFMSDTLLGVYYGIEEIASGLEQVAREERIKNAASFINKG